MVYDLKTQVTNFVFAVACLILFFFFPVDQMKVQILISVLVFLLILPILYVRVVLHERINSMGMTSYGVLMKDVLYLIGAMFLGVIMGFGIVKMQWGVQDYVETLSPAILYDFRGFLIYQMIFTLPSIFLYVFFAWGFVFYKTWSRYDGAFLAATATFLLLLANFYQSMWMIMPALPLIFVYYMMRERVHIAYLACAFFIVSLLIDTLIITLGI